MPVARVWIRRLSFLGLGLAALVPLAPLSLAQSLAPQLYSEMRWRTIGPTRAGRARAVVGSPSQPNVAYIGFDNGGVWRSSDYGSTWTPIFDHESTGSIGAIAVAPSDPNTDSPGTCLTHGSAGRADRLLMWPGSPRRFRASPCVLRLP